MDDKEKGGAATLPDALAKRELTVMFEDGSGSVTIKKWAWAKSTKILRTLWAFENSKFQISLQNV